MTDIVCWSGGPDSTLLLYDMLQKGPVVALVIHEDSVSRGASMAMRRCVRILAPQMANVGRMDLREVWIKGDRSDQSNEQLTINTTAGTILIASQYADPVIYWGRCAHDKDPEFESNEIMNRTFLDRHQEMIEKTCGPVVRHGYDLTKAKIRERLGMWWGVTVSCLNHSMSLKPCGVCEKCRERGQA